MKTKSFKSSQLVITIVLITVLTVLGSCSGGGKTVSIYFEKESPQHTFAAGDINGAMYGGP